MLTEEEAKTKWCPFARTAVLGGVVSRNRWADDPNPNACRCIGSACVAWRWGREEVDGAPNLNRRSTTRGYCGLAGKP